MSAESTRRIFESFERRLAGVERIDNPMELMAEFFAAMARDLAEDVFLSAHTCPGMTQQGAQRFADEVMLQHGLDITETIHTFGGTPDMVLNLTEVAQGAYSERLSELSTGDGQGGVA